MSKQDKYVVNSVESLADFLKQVTDWFEEYKYLSFKEPAKGFQRSLGQNSLFHVWLTTLAAFYLGKHKKDVTETELEAMKQFVKAKCYQDHPEYEFLIGQVLNPFTGDYKTKLTSSADWKHEEMFLVLTWMQQKASGDGLTLVSSGKFKELQQQNA